MYTTNIMFLYFNDANFRFVTFDYCERNKTYLKAVPIGLTGIQNYCCLLN